MEKRYASIWFPYLLTDRHTVRRPGLRTVPFVLATPVHGRMVITEANAAAEAQGITRSMVVVDAKACIPDLEVADDRPGLADRLLKILGLWCIRYTPVVAVDLPDGLVLRSEEHTSELQSLMRISYAVFCLKKKIKEINI